MQPETLSHVTAESVAERAASPVALNPAQQASVCHGARSAAGAWTSGPLLVIAGAGTGKTHTLADLAASSWLAIGTMFGLPLERHPRTAAWCKRCTERPAFKRAR